MKRKIIIAAAVVAAVGILVGFIRMPGMGGSSGNNNGDAASSVRTSVLEKGALAATVSATGTVYSVESTNVYSNLNYSVKKVHVEAGDRVEAGDVLAELDTSSLESDIAQKNASISSAQATASQNLSTAKKDLETYKRNLEENYETSLIDAQAKVNSAEQSLEAAKREVQASELDLQSANASLVSARRQLREGRDDSDDVELTDSELNKLKDSVRSAEISVEKAETSLEKAKANVENAEKSLEEAKQTLEAKNAATGDTIGNYEDKVKSAQLSTDFNDQWISVQKLQSDLESCVIASPVSGTVTSVSAVEGASGNGLLFVIQDTDNLKVVANIKEYDIASVSIGDKVNIKSDATGDETIEGRLSKIAPTSTETATGLSSDSTDAEYESEVTVPSKNSGLRIGMNARLSIVTEEKKDIYYVSYEAIGTDGGGSFIWTAALQEDGSYIAEAVPVETGLETDLYTEIIGDKLTDGMIVVRDASSVQAGDVIPVSRPGGEAQNGEAPEGGSDENKQSRQQSGGSSGQQSGGGSGQGGARVVVGGGPPPQ